MPGDCDMLKLEPASLVTCDVVDFSKMIIHPNMPPLFREEIISAQGNRNADFEAGLVPEAGKGLHFGCAIISAGCVALKIRFEDLQV